MVGRIREKWEELDDTQRIVSAILLFVLGQILLFCLTYVCGWVIVLRWVSDVVQSSS